MTKNHDILPPEKSLTATKPNSAPMRAPSETSPPVPNLNGIVETLVTGFKAKLQADAYGHVKDRIDAKTGVVEAETALVKSAGVLKRAYSEFDEIDAVIENDKAQRAADRARDAHNREVESKGFEAKYDIAARRLNVEKMTLEAQEEEARYRLAQAKDGREYFEKSLELRHKFRDAALQGKTANAEFERKEAENIARNGKSAASFDPRQAYIDHLHRNIEKAVADGDHDAAQRYRADLTKITEQ